MISPRVVPVVLCGGSGTRLWPASREKYPKQFLSLINEESLLQNTLRRALAVSGADASSVLVVTLEAMADQVAAQLFELYPGTTFHLLQEPCARNTAAAIAYAAEYARGVYGDDAVLWILPSDHHIGNQNALSEAFRHGLKAAMENNLVTFGIKPTRPETGYGYILTGNITKSYHVYHVEKFVEKPDFETAQSYLDSGDYLWNSGMFLFSVKTVLGEYDSFAPAILNDVRSAMTSSPLNPSPTIYAQIPSKPFDKVIMEKSSGVCVVPCDPQWSDVGSWESLWTIGNKDINRNVVTGNVINHKTSGCLVRGQKKPIVLCGIKDTIVLETDDMIFVADKNDSESLKELIKTLKELGHDDMIDGSFSSGPQKQALKKAKSRTQ